MKPYRTKRGKVVLGICAGIGEAYNWDPNIVRLAFITLTGISYWVGLGAYTLLYFLTDEAAPSRYVIETTAKKLYRSRTQRIVFGVIGGVSEYFGIHPMLARLAFLFSLKFAPFLIVFYLVASFIIPEKY